MAHPYHEHKQHKVEHRRVAHIAHGHKHRASGGRVHEEEAGEHKGRHEESREIEGKKARHRHDRVMRAKGGRVKKGATHVNVIVNGGDKHPSAPPAMMAPPPMAPSPPAPPVAGLGGPPPGMPPGGPGGPPPMLPPRARGGPVEAPKTMKPYRKGGHAHRAAGGPVEAPEHGHTKYRAHGGAAKSGPAWEEGKHAGTPVQPSDALSVTKKNMGRGRQVTFNAGGRAVSFRAHGGGIKDDSLKLHAKEHKAMKSEGIMRARGGPIESTYKVDPATKLPGGGGGGAGRRAKIHKYGYGKPMHGENEAR